MMSYGFSLYCAIPFLPSFHVSQKGRKGQKEESAGARLVCAHCFSLRCGFKEGHILVTFTLFHPQDLLIV